MLIRIEDPGSVSERKLMDIYAESNRENTGFFCPGEPDPAEAVKQVEQGFLNYLKNDFLTREGNVLWVLEEDGTWVSALRTYRISDGLYYLEALETRPDKRRMGYGAALLKAVLSAMKETGGFRLCSCVGKRNEASLATHKRCGFSIVSEEGHDYLTNETDEGCYGLEYRYPDGASLENRSNRSK